MKIETKHTHGPWAWQKFGDKYCLTAQHGMREIILSANAKREVVMNTDGILRPVDPNHPNAKLIELAPDMYDALRMVQAETENSGTYIKIESIIRKIEEL
jgi:hypothetical protein